MARKLLALANWIPRLNRGMTDWFQMRCALNTPPCHYPVRPGNLESWGSYNGRISMRIQFCLQFSSVAKPGYDKHVENSLLVNYGAYISR